MLVSCCFFIFVFFFFFKQKTAYEMRISDWSSDVCSSDLFSPYEGFPNQYMDMTSNKSWYLNGHWKGAFDWGDLDLRAFYRDTDHRMNFLADKGGTATGGMPMNTEVHRDRKSTRLNSSH